MPTVDYYNTIQERYDLVISNLNDARIKATSDLKKLQHSKFALSIVQQEIDKILSELQSKWNLNVLDRIEADMKIWANTSEESSAYELGDEDDEVDESTDREYEIYTSYLDIKNLVGQLWEWWGRNLDWRAGYYPDIQILIDGLEELDSILSDKINFLQMSDEESAMIIEGPNEQPTEEADLSEEAE